MQTFLAYPNFTLSAKILDRSRLGKQRIECLQILKVLQIGPIQRSLTPQRGFKYHDGLYERKTPWYNHPAVKMWKGYSAALYLYTKEVCIEWVARGYKDTCLEKASNYVDNPNVTLLPDWFGDERFHLSHQSNLKRKKPDYYGQFFLGVPDDLPYIWPVK